MDTIDENEIEMEELETDEAFEEVAEKAESAQETAQAVWEELSAKAEAEPKEEAAPVEEKPNEITEAARKLAGAKKGKKRQTFVPEQAQGAVPPGAPAVEKYEPPVGFPVEDKEWFLSQPPQVQKNAATWFKNAQAKTTKIWQDLQREASTAKELNEVANEFVPKMKLPPGMTKGQAVRQLFEYQQAINEDDVGAIAEMIRYRGLDIQDVYARLQGQTQAPVRQHTPQQQPQSSLTADEVLRIIEQRDQHLNQQRTVSDATEQVRALGQEMQNGRYVWPEMHDPQAIQRIQDLITYFRKTNPNLGWQGFYKQAILQDRANRGTGSPSSSAQRLTPENIQAVKQASSSLRSRGGNGAIPRMSEPKPNESARESAEAAYYEVFGNKQH